MNPIFKIINYLFKKQKINNKDTTFTSFFGNGVMFPKLVAISLKIKQVPNIFLHPQNNSEKMLNNDIAFKYLAKNNSNLFNNDINNKNFSDLYKTEEEQSKLLMLILTKLCFNIDFIDILKTCNLIVSPIGIKFKDDNDLMRKQSILALLNSLTIGNIPLQEETENFNDLMKDIFEKEKIPLVIDETSLNDKNIFFIQIQIIFDTFQVQKKQLKKDSKSEIQNQEEQKRLNSTQTSKEKIIRPIEINQIFENSKTKNDVIDTASQAVLLKTLNAIYPSGKLTNLQQAIEKNYLQNFVSIFINDNSLVTSNKDSITKIYDVIKYLGRKENGQLFNVLFFNFTDSKFALASTVLFYTTFLNIYFLKKSKSELLERLSIIILSNLQQNDDLYNTYIAIKEGKTNLDEKILLNWKTYLALANFVNTKTTHFRSSFLRRDDSYFKLKKIPQIINEEYLKKFQDTVPNYTYYQLQFIFDIMDKLNSDHRIIETFLRAQTKLQKTKVPQFDDIASIIRGIFIPKLAQIKEYKEFINRKKINSVEVFDLNVNDDIEDPKLETFKKSDLFGVKSEIKSHSSIDLSSAVPFWNDVTFRSYFKDGVLYWKIPDVQSPQKWDDYFNSFKNDRDKYVKIVQSSQKDKLFTSIPKDNKKALLYKFFEYEPKKKQWTINNKSIDQFFADSGIIKQKLTTPLIFFSNSYKQDINAIVSNLSKSSLPDCDDENIYIYAICGKSLESLQYRVNNNSKYRQYTPIFTLLHVPRNYEEFIEKDDHIESIIFKINYFLSLICDIKIVVLNKDHCLEQINFLEIYDRAKRSNDELIQEFTHDTESSEFSIQNIDFSSDGEDDFHEINATTSFSFCTYGTRIIRYIEENYDMTSINNVLKSIPSRILMKPSRYIILVNSKEIQNEVIEIDDNIFFKKEFSSDMITENLKINYIDVNNPITYQGFLTNLCQFSLNVQNSYNNPLNNNILYDFKYYEVTKLCNLYIYIRGDIDQWNDKLEGKIKQRFKQLIELNRNKTSSITILSILSTEVLNFIPYIDSDFHMKCNSILTKINNEVIDQYRGNIEKELNLRSKSHLDYLSTIINAKKVMLDPVSDLIDSHTRFLENEYFTIIHELFSKNDQLQVFSKNRDTLISLIIKDTAEIQKYYKEKKLSLIKPEEEKQININSGTNYTIRERENIKEIEVAVQAGNLDGVIEQDF